jgi:hypothetical protein
MGSPRALAWRGFFLQPCSLYRSTLGRPGGFSWSTCTCVLQLKGRQVTFGIGVQCMLVGLQIFVQHLWSLADCLHARLLGLGVCHHHGSCDQVDGHLAGCALEVALVELMARELLLADSAGEGFRRIPCMCGGMPRWGRAWSPICVFFGFFLFWELQHLSSRLLGYHLCGSGTTCPSSLVMHLKLGFQYLPSLLASYLEYFVRIWGQQGRG